MPDLRPVHEELCRRLSVHEDVFEATHNLTDANTTAGQKVDEPSPDSHLLMGSPTERYPDGVMFAAVKLGKRYVSYHLMSLYEDADGVDSMSAALRQRMQGKSCFNFTRIDEELFDELADLTAAGRDRYATRGLLRR